MRRNQRRKQPDRRWWRLLGFKWELIQRDPLGWKVIEYVFRPSDAPDDPQASQAYRENRQKLAQKYRCRIYIPELAWRGGLTALPRDRAKRLALTAAGNQQPFSWHVMPPPPPPFARLSSSGPWRPQTFIFTIDLSLVTKWDLQRLENAFRSALRQAIKDPSLSPWVLEVMLPHPPKPDPPWVHGFTVNLEGAKISHLSRHAHRFKTGLKGALGNLATHTLPDPKELLFLRTVTEKNFLKDLKRYDRHVTRGLPCRHIAWLESQEKKGKGIPEKPPHRVIRHKVREESSVLDSVQRIFLAIHRKPYRVRDRRRDTPAIGVELYQCPQHGSKCLGTLTRIKGKSVLSIECSYAREWYRGIKKILPSDLTALGRDLVGYPDPIHHLLYAP